MKYEVFLIDSQGTITVVALTNNHDDAKMIAAMFEWRDKIRHHGRRYDFRIKGIN